MHESLARHIPHNLRSRENLDLELIFEGTQVLKTDERRDKLCAGENMTFSSRFCSMLDGPEYGAASRKMPLQQCRHRVHTRVLEQRLARWLRKYGFFETVSQPTRTNHRHTQRLVKGNAT